MAKARKDINALTETELGNYIHALNVLRSRSAVNPDDETGYDFQAALHNDVFVGPCEHGSDLFLAWHRAHLHYFEQLLQGSDPPRTANVTIPYWDWIHPEAIGKFPQAFDKPGLSTAGRNTLVTPLPPDTLSIVTTEINWNLFGGFPTGDPRGDYGRLEYGPHNRMHGFVIGGPMANPATAAEDPIYWSFHAFIDLLCAEWQRRNPAATPTSPQANLRGFLTRPRHKVENFQSTQSLDYEYLYSDQLRQAFSVGLQPSEERRLLTTDQLEPLFEADLPDVLSATAMAGFAMASPPAAARAAVIRLRNLKVPTTGSYLLTACVHPKSEPPRVGDPDFERRYGVGYVALWRAHAAPAHSHHGPTAPHPHHPTACTVRFDVSRALIGLPPATVSDLVLTLHYVPAPDSTGAPLADPALIREVELEAVLLEAYEP